jgi:hypothetical protein
VQCCGVGLGEPFKEMCVEMEKVRFKIGFGDGICCVGLMEVEDRFVNEDC